MLIINACFAVAGAPISCATFSSAMCSFIRTCHHGSLGEITDGNDGLESIFVLKSFCGRASSCSLPHFLAHGVLGKVWGLSDKGM